MKSRYGLEIRGATTAEAPGLAELLAAGGHPVPAAVLASRLEAMRETTGAVLVALEWGPPSGLLVLHWYRSPWSDAPVAQVTTLLVGAAERRRGIGRMLLKAASQAARVAGCDVLEVMAPPGAEGLAAFCHATGFVAAGQSYSRSLRKK